MSFKAAIQIIWIAASVIGLLETSLFSLVKPNNSEIHGSDSVHKAKGFHDLATFHLDIGESGVCSC
jgi:hypothetical protein